MHAVDQFLAAAAQPVGAADLGRVEAEAFGLALAEIRDIFDLYGRDDGLIAQNTYALRKYRERIAAFEVQRQEIDKAIAGLHIASAQLEEELNKSGRAAA